MQYRATLLLTMCVAVFIGLLDARAEEAAPAALNFKVKSLPPRTLALAPKRCGLNSAILPRAIQPRRIL